MSRPGETRTSWHSRLDSTRRKQHAEIAVATAAAAEAQATVVFNIKHYKCLSSVEAILYSLSVRYTSPSILSQPSTPVRFLLVSPSLPKSPWPRAHQKGMHSKRVRQPHDEHVEVTCDSMCHESFRFISDVACHDILASWHHGLPRATNPSLSFPRGIDMPWHRGMPHANESFPFLSFPARHAMACHGMPRAT